eukprot:gene38636-46969_t
MSTIDLNQHIVGPNDSVTVFHSLLHGDGVQAVLPIGKDCVVFREKPHLFLQTLPNRRSVLVCSNCAQFLGSVGLQMKLLQNQVSRQDLFGGHLAAFFNPYKPLTEHLIPCQGGCGEAYCNLSCRDYHWNKKGHKYLCTGQINPAEADSHPLFAFKMHAVQTNEIFLMVADVFAEFCASYEQLHIVQGNPRSVVIGFLQNFYQGYVRQLWWEAAQPPKGQTKAKFTKTLKRLVSDSYSMLVSSLPVEEYNLQSVLSEEFMSRCIGMFEQNNVGVRLRNPVAAFVDSIESFEQADMFARELLSDVQLIAANLENEVCMDDACSEGGDDDEYEDIEDGEEEENVVSTEDGVVNAADVIDESTGNPDLDIVHDTISQYGEDSFLPPLDGTAFYFMICKINHSCIPNVIVKYVPSENAEGLVAQLVALRDILPGEELVQSYVDASLPTSARAKLLSEYGFACSCAKCVA